MTAAMVLKIAVHQFCFGYKICFEITHKQLTETVEAIHLAIYKKFAYL